MTMFAVITILALLIFGLALAFRRFRIQHPSAEGNILYAAIIRDFRRWLGQRIPAVLSKPAPAGWPAWIKGFRLWRLPLFEKWLLIGFYGSFLYLAASGFFFAVFIKRGLYGFPLVLHVMGGALFAVCLTLIAFLRARRFTFNPGPLALPGDLDAIRKFRIPWGARDWAKGFFWLFLLAGFSLAASALLPMLPWFPYEGQIILFGWHRWSALVSLLAAIAFADLGLFRPKPEA
ncbi:MAG: hypothetical protein ABSG73_02445 [Candidatus Aminicenantales bacterium]|jgi:hypothetical protein